MKKRPKFESVIGMQLVMPYHLQINMVMNISIVNHEVVVLVVLVVLVLVLVILEGFQLFQMVVLNHMMM